MNLPLVSIIIPTYNREASVIVTLNSIISQTYSAIEVWVVDDGSTDDTEAVVSSFISDYRGPFSLNYVKQENAGAPSARNNGFSRSKGEYVVFFDSDDEMLPNRIELQVNSMLQEQSDACTASFSVYRNGVLAKIRTNYVWEGLSPLDNWLMFYVKGKGYLGGTQGWMYKRELIDKVGGYDVLMKRSQDLDLNFRILSLPNIKISVVNEPVTKFNDDDRPDRIMKSVWKSEKALASEKRLMEKIFSCNQVITQPDTFKRASFFFLRSYIKGALKMKDVMWAYKEYNMIRNIQLNMSFFDMFSCRLYALVQFIISVFIAKIIKKR